MKHRTLSQWREIIEQQKISGLSVLAYCQQQELNIKTFYRNRRKLSLDEQSQAPTLLKDRSASTGFIQVKTAPPVQLPTHQIILKTHQAMLQLPSDVSPQWVGQLLRELHT